MGRSISRVIEELSPARRARIEGKAGVLAREMIDYADNLGAVRKVFNKTQADVGKVLGIQQNAIAQLEQRSDLLLSTLQRYVEAMGGELNLVIRMANGSSMLLEGLGALGSNKAKASNVKTGRKPHPKARAAAKSAMAASRKRTALKAK